MIRLYLDAPLSAAQEVKLGREQTHYLGNVMRLRAGAALLLFNGRDGEWHGEILSLGKKETLICLSHQTRPQQMPPDLWLLFAPIKKARTDFIVEKAAELGVARICPVICDHSNAERVNIARLQAHAVEAAEQCGGLFVPPIAAPVPLSELLSNWPSERQLLFCNETLAGQDFVMPPADGEGDWAILVGPEGGFSTKEIARLTSLPQSHPISLGPRILRADTAAVAVLALWQAHLGDWKEG